MKQNRIVMLLEESTADNIKKIASKEGYKVSELIRKIIKGYLKFKTKKTKK